MYYAYQTGTGFGFIPVSMESLYPGGVPASAIQITDEQHKGFLEKQSQGKQSGFNIVDGVWTYMEPAALPPQIITPEINQDIADMWEAMLSMSAEIETLKGGV